MRTLLFVMLPTPSHYMTSFPIAHEFENKGLKVIFTGNQDAIQSLVKQNGFYYESMLYQNSDVIKGFKVFVSFFIVSLLSKPFIFERYREYYSNILEIKRLIKTTQADSVFIDEHLSHYYFYFIREKCKIYLINTKLLTSKNGNNPPINTTYLPNSTFVFRIINKLLWFKVSVKHLLISLKFKTAFLGKDDEFFTKRFCQKNNIDYEKIINRKNLFYYGIKNIKRIILAPKYLDPVLKNENNIYIFLEDKRNENNLLSEEYLHLKNMISIHKYCKILLCSFGTLVSENEKAIFLNKLNVSVKGENFLLIVVSRDLDIIKNRNDNVHIYPSVPQLDLLKHCDLMIHHGGFNTIKECMQFQVPMLIYALNRKSFDWLGNAARVKWRGLGIVGNIYKDDHIKIKENIKKALKIKMPKYDFESEYSKLNKFIEEELLDSFNMSLTK